MPNIKITLPHPTIIAKFAFFQKLKVYVYNHAHPVEIS